MLTVEVSWPSPPNCCPIATPDFTFSCSSLLWYYYALLDSLVLLRCTWVFCLWYFPMTVPLLGMAFPQMTTCSSPSPPSSLLQCQLLSKASLVILSILAASSYLWSFNFNPPFLCIFSLAHITISHTLYFTFKLYFLFVSPTCNYNIHSMMALIPLLFPPVFPVSKTVPDHELLNRYFYLKEWIWWGL